MHLIALYSLQVVLLIGSRLIGLPPNVSPLGTAGFTQKNPLPFFAAILGFDMLFGGLYAGVVWTYIGFAGYYLLGLVARHYKRNSVLLLPIASTWFFTFSNIGPWLHWYEPTLNGLLTCYAVALPFYAYTLIGDCGFGALYAAFTYAKNNSKLPTQPIALRPSKA